MFGHNGALIKDCNKPTHCLIQPVSVAVTTRCLILPVSVAVVKVCQDIMLPLSGSGTEVTAREVSAPFVSFGGNS